MIIPNAEYAIVDIRKRSHMIKLLDVVALTEDLPECNLPPWTGRHSG